MLDAFDYLRRNKKEFDVIYVAPPQYLGLWVEVMKLLDERPSDYLTSDGIVIVQIDPKEYKELELTHLTLYQSRRYGNTQLCFYEIEIED